MQPRPKPATYADIEALPPNIVGQIVFGVLHAHPRPAPKHARATGRLGSLLDGPFDDGRGGPGGWLFLIEPELHLGEHVVVPDIAGWRRERMPTVPDTAFIDIAPDWLCEVLSPSTQRFDRTDKLAVYATFSVGHCWYVDPIANTLEVLERHLPSGVGARAKWLIAATFKDADPICASPFEAHTFGLDALWG